MITQVAAIFLDVLTPVLALVALGYVVGPRLGLEGRTLSRFAYYVLTPAFVFDILSRARMEATLALRMTLYISLVLLGCALLALVAAKLLRRSPQMTSAYVLVAVFANVGNFGLPIGQFALGPEALVAVTIYFLAILSVSLLIGVVAASWNSGGGMSALLAVLRTPGLTVLPPALLCAWLDLPLPSALTRPVALLSGAMVPTMLVTLGIQLAATERPRLSLDLLVACSIRLLAGPALALALAPLWGLDGIERSAGVLQASMPVAVLASIIAGEHNLLPGFVNGAVLFSTLASIVTLTLVISM